MQRVAENHEVVVDLKPWETNLRVVAVEVLKTLLLLDQNYGINYIARLLRGEKSKFKNNPEHLAFETFGSCPKYSHYDLRLVIQELVLKGFVDPVDSTFSTVQITARGRAYLDNPGAILVDAVSVRLTVGELYLLRKFGEYRSEKAVELEVMPFEIFNDFSLDRLVKDRPTEINDLKLIPGMTHEKADLYGEDLLQIVEESIANWNEIRLKGILRKSKHETHQRVFRMYQNTQDIHEISRTIGIAEITVKLYLGHFHQLGEIDLTGDLENWVDAGTLHRGSEYFRRVARPTLKEAARSLGMDIFTAQLCMAYAAEVPITLEKASA